MDETCCVRHALEYQGTGHHQGTAAARDAVKKEALRKAGIGYHEVVAGHTAPAELKRLADAARAGLAAREELSGSTITVTSLGALGGIVSTPVVNRPEVAIIGVNRMAVRPMWMGNAVVPRTMMNLSSSFDHRVVDGYDAAVFIQRIKGLLEMPARIFIGG